MESKRINSCKLIELNQNIISEDWYKDINSRITYLHLLLRCNSIPTEVDEKLINVGEYVGTFDKLAIEVGITTKQLRTAIKKLVAIGKCKYTHHSNYNIFTVYSECLSAQKKPKKRKANANTLAEPIYTTEGLIIAEKPKTLEERKVEFGLKLKDFADKYDREMLKSFYNHWTEHNEGGKKMLFEMKKTFNLSGRLATWKTNNDNRIQGKVAKKETTLEKYKKTHERIRETRGQ